MQRHAITDRTRFSGDETARLRAMLDAAVRSASDGRNDGADIIQLREKDLTARELETLARELTGRVRAATAMTRVVVNGRPDIAIAAGADGVHLRADETLPITDVRRLFYQISRPEMLIGISCHTVEEVAAAASQQPDYIIYGPVYEKQIASAAAVAGVGLAALTQAARAAGEIPVIAIGGVTRATEWDCIRAGAGGVASIRMFLPTE
jgi:thiamine-phosphate pyrophosphorylase